jgi:SAM-dependent methyltransferase
LSLLLAQHGHRVTAVDLSPRMVEVARRKVAGLGVRVLVGAMPDPVAALRHWIGLSRPVLWGRAITDERYCIVAAI